MKLSIKVVLSIACCGCVTSLPTFAQQPNSPQKTSILLSNLKSTSAKAPQSEDVQTQTTETQAQNQSRVLTSPVPSGKLLTAENTLPAGDSKASIAARSAQSNSDLKPVATKKGTNQTEVNAPEKSLGHEDLDALLWLRTSVEFDAMTRQTFATATTKLGEALVDPKWTALTQAEQSPNQNDLPPCVIVDVDETILDNSQYQLELIRDKTQYDTDKWNEFVQRRSSPAIDGAVEFAAACRAGGVEIFFVTNREAKVEAATRDNLIAQRLMDPSDPDRILSKNERPNWSSDKSSRRQEIAKTHRVLLLIGDDLNDFVSAKNLPIAQRQQLYKQNKKNWGQSWFVMPNPNYGGWESATINNQYQATPERKL